MAATGGNKKRKEPASSAEQSAKMIDVDAPRKRLKLTTVTEPKSQVPIIFDTPPFDVPDDLTLQEYEPASYERADAARLKPVFERRLTAYSESRPQMKYTLREESRPGLTDWIGIVDPKTGETQLIRAKRMVMSCVVRARDGPADGVEEKGAQKSVQDLRVDLAQTFGTKKAKQAIQKRALNAILPQEKSNDQPAKMDDSSRTILHTLGESVADMATAEQLQAAVDEAKPRPIVNADADDIHDVYDPSVIIGRDILQMLPIRDWQEKARQNENIQTSSRFVAARINAIARNDGAEQRLRVLRYLSFLIRFYRETKPGRQKGMRVAPQHEKLREALAPAPEPVIENIRRKFSERGQLRRFHVDLLMTHVCAFACIVDSFEVGLDELMQDLLLDEVTIKQYFREIGARIKPVPASKAKGGRAGASVARLSLPIEFPKQRRFKPRR